MARGDLLNSVDRAAGQILVVPFIADQPWSRSLAERRAKTNMRRSANENFVKILDGLDEMCLADDDVRALRNLNSNGLQFHGSPALPQGLKPSRAKIKRNVTALHCNGSPIAWSYSN